MVLLGAGGNGKPLFMGKELSLCKTKRFGGGWSNDHSTLCMYAIQWSAHLKQSWWETLRYIYFTTMNHKGLRKALDAGSQCDCHCLQSKRILHLPLVPLILYLRKKEALYFRYTLNILLYVLYMFIYFIHIYRLYLVYVYILATTTALIPTSPLRVLIRVEIAYFCLRWIKLLSSLRINNLKFTRCAQIASYVQSPKLCAQFPPGGSLYSH